MFSYMGKLCSQRDKTGTSAGAHEIDAPSFLTTSYTAIHPGSSAPQGAGGSSQREVVEMQRNIVPLEQTTSDAALFITCAFEDSSIKKDFWAYYQSTFGLLLQCTTFLLQFLITFMLFATVVEQSEEPYQHGLSGHTAIIRNATAHGVTIDRHDEYMGLCREDETLTGTRQMVVFIWTSRMVQEIRSGAKRIHLYLEMPTDGIGVHGSNEVQIIDEHIEYKHGVVAKESYGIIAFTTRIRLFFICMGLCHMFNATFLTWTSAKYLVLEGQTEKVLLKAVSMQFIVQLELLMFKSFMPHAFTNKVKAAKLICGSPPPELWQQWASSTSILVIAFMFQFCLFNIWFAEITDFRGACKSYYFAFPDERDHPVGIMDTLALAMPHSWR